jgi:TPR repeat protein
MRFYASLTWILPALLMAGAPVALAQTPAKDTPAAAQQKATPEAKKKAAAKPKPKAKPDAKAKPEIKKKAKPKPVVSKQQQDEYYRQGLAHEGKGDHQAALTAYLEAGNAGHGLAQRKLGDIYGKGNKAVKRDYDTSLRWYEKARAQGVEIPKPHAFTKGR